MPSCSQLTNEWCRKCEEETLHVIDRCNHCGTVRKVLGGPAFEVSRSWSLKRRVNFPSGRSDPDGSGNFSYSGSHLTYGGNSDEAWQG